MPRILVTTLDGVGFLASLASASVSLFLGKLLAAGIFVLLAVVILNRFVRRRSGVVDAQPPAVWIPVVCAVASAVETGIVVEAVNLPVRFDQPGFDRGNLLFVAAVLLFLFFAQRGVLRRLFARRTTAIRDGSHGRSSGDV
jgi:hypothetical protein